jgi:hypothetical protein
MDWIQNVKQVNVNVFQIDESRRLVRCYFNQWVVIDKDCIILHNISKDFCKYLNQDKITEIEELMLEEINP